MKNNNYYTIQGWMVNELKITGNELMIYAIIYGFSQDGESEFTGSLSYLQSFIGVGSKNTVRGSLNSLIEKGFVIKTENYINNLKLCKYKCNLSILTGGSNFEPEISAKSDTVGQILNGRGAKSDTVGQILNGRGAKSDTVGGAKSDTNNKYSINNNIEEEEEEKSATSAPSSSTELKKEDIEEIGSEVVQNSAREAYNDKWWVENVRMANDLSDADVKKWMAKYNSSLCNDVIHNFNTRTYKKMFTGWLSKQISKGYSIKSNLEKQAVPIKTIN